jgi:hypothetical protein
VSNCGGKRHASSSQAKHMHTATASYASHWGKTKEIRFESEKVM